jgi:Plasmid pRiA4b ORF-3-like protein
MVWRRLLVRSDSTIAELHYTLQTAFDWSDEHLHRFGIHGQDHGVSRAGGIIFSAGPAKVRLSHFKFRRNESLRYEYDFVAGSEHHVRVEGRLALEDKAGTHAASAAAGEPRLRLCGASGGVRRACAGHTALWFFHPR